MDQASFAENEISDTGAIRECQTSHSNPSWPYSWPKRITGTYRSTQFHLMTCGILAAPKHFLPVCHCVVLPAVCGSKVVIAFANGKASFRKCDHQGIGNIWTFLPYDKLNSAQIRFLVITLQFCPAELKNVENFCRSSPRYKSVPRVRKLRQSISAAKILCRKHSRGISNSKSGGKNRIFG